MTYNDWLEKELNIYKRENKLLNEKIDSLADIYVTVGEKSKKLQEQNDKKKDILKWAYSLEKENKQLKEKLEHSDFVKASLFDDREDYKQRISKLVSENVELQNELFSEDLIQYETEDYINKLKNELFNLYLKHYN